METALLHIEILPELLPVTLAQKVNIKLEESPVLICQGISVAMQAQQDICATIIAGVVHWCLHNNVDPGDLKDMVKFHG